MPKLYSKCQKQLGFLSWKCSKSIRFSDKFVKLTVFGCSKCRHVRFIYSVKWMSEIRTSKIWITRRQVVNVQNLNKIAFGFQTFTRLGHFMQKNYDSRTHKRSSFIVPSLRLKSERQKSKQKCSVFERSVCWTVSGNRTIVNFPKSKLVQISNIHCNNKLN